MSSRNTEMDGTIMALMLIAMVVIFIAKVVFAIMLFVAIILTILSLFALKGGLTIGDMTITREEAKAFISRGLFGAAIIPTFVWFAMAIFQHQVPETMWPYLGWGGYAYGSVVVGIWEAVEKEKAEAAAKLLPPWDIDPPTKPTPTMRVIRPEDELEEEKPFEFAKWDDEEDRK